MYCKADVTTGMQFAAVATVMFTRMRIETYIE